MKKKKYIFLLLIIAFLVCGCSREKILTCKLESNQEASGYSLKSNYDIKYKGTIVTEVEYYEEITSTNNTILAYFEKMNNEQYKSLNDKYDGYKFEVSNKDGKVITKVIISFDQLDIKKYVEDNPALESFVNKENKMTLDGVKTLYESYGATCDK